MSSWQKVRLGDICDIQTGPFGSQLHNKDYVAVGTPIVTVEHLGNRYFTTQNLPCVKLEDKQRLSKYILEYGDVVFSRVGSVDRCSFVDKSTNGWLFSGRCLRVRPSAIISGLFLYYQLNLDVVKQHIRSIAVGATMPSINTKLMQNLEICLPPLEEQERIAKILGSLDDKIELNNKINRNLEAQAEALFKQWFVDFDFPDPSGNPYRTSGGAMVDSPMGKIPDGWRVGKLTEIGTIVAGGTPSKAKSEYYTDDGIAWITPKDLSVNKCKFISKGEIDITEIGYSSSSARLMPKGSVLFSSRAPIGYIAIAKNDISTNQGFKSVVPNEDIGTPYIYYYLIDRIESIENMASGSTFKEASGALMKNLDIIIPSLDVLQKFNYICNSLFLQQESLEMENQHLVQLRDSLLPKLMNNEIKL